MLKPTLSELFNSSFKSILKNKARTILTSLGIIIGVSSVILLTSIGNGLKAYVSDQFDQLGATTIFVSPGQIFNSQGGFNRGGASALISRTFDQRDIRNLTRQLRGYISSIVPSNQTPIKIRYQSQEEDSTMLGTTADYPKVGNTNLDSGRWFTQLEQDKKDKVIVLGFGIAQNLFGQTNPVNKKVIIDGSSFKVVGVAEKQGNTFGGPDFDSYTFVPLDTLQSITGNTSIQSMNIKVKDKDQIDQAIKITKDTLSQRYDPDTFSVFDSSQLLSSINSILNTLTVALGGIAAISLVVGGIGIMNIMLVTVTERTREIGLRKAVGAYPRAILLQFLFEAVILSSVGGLIGILIGFTGSFFINKFFPSTITLNSILLAFGVSFIVGIVFGVAPARKASKLDPIQALKYE